MSKLKLLFNEVRDILSEAGGLKLELSDQSFSAAFCASFGSKSEHSDLLANDTDDDTLTVIHYFIDLVQQIDEASKEDQKKNGDIFTVSLGDIRLLNAFIDLIVIQYIYPNLSPGVGIPLEKRLKNMPPNKIIHISKRLDILRYVVDSFVDVVKSEDDIADILMGGQYSTDIISGLMELAYGPNAAAESKLIYSHVFTDFLSRIETYTLISYLTMLTHQSTPFWCSQIIVRLLAMIPVSRPSDGVKALIEYIGGLREDEQISIEKLQRVSKILSAVPKGVRPTLYFSHVGEQLLAILMSSQKGLLVSSTVQVVDTMRKTRGSVVKDFIFQPLILSFVPSSDTIRTKTEVIVTDLDLTKALTGVLNIVRNLTTESNEELLAPIFYSLWALECFQRKSKRVYDSTRDLLLTYIKLGDSAKKIADLIEHVRCDLEFEWRYGSGENGQVEIRKSGRTYTELAAEEDVLSGLGGVEMLDQRVELLLQLIDNLDKTALQSVFVATVRRWLGKRGDTNSDPFIVFVDVRILEGMLDKHKAEVIYSPTEIISLVSSILDEYISSLREKEDEKILAKPISEQLSSIAIAQEESDADSDDEDEEKEQTDTDQEAVSIALSLLSAIVSESLLGAGGRLTKQDERVLRSFGPTLQYISEHASGSVLSSASTLSALLNETEISLASTGASQLSQSQQQYQQAILNLKDPLVPIRAHGLHQLRTLVLSKDPIIKITEVLRLYLSVLNDEDSFVYLNCIKGLQTLTDIYGIQVIKSLIERYTAAGKSPTLDERLRIGEAILRTVQRLGDALGGQNAKVITRAMIKTVIDRKLDTRLRSSALSILGMACETNPVGLEASAKDSIECALGVLTFETTEDKAILRRAAVVLIGSMLKGVQDLQDFSGEVSREVVRSMRYVRTVDKDAVVRVQAGNVLDIVGDMIADKLSAV
ncbi:hypothetical protein V1512DRAFT_257019 [Lipomyces arxii]|uniref:uncharacterized protein n=1 Tax=Lipomyces arxii TaxID=56418 RepID=UPI0034CED6DF